MKIIMNNEENLLNINFDHMDIVKPLQNGHSQKDKNLVFKTNYRLVQVKYLGPLLSYQLSFRHFCIFLSGRFTQVLLAEM